MLMQLSLCQCVVSAGCRGTSFCVSVILLHLAGTGNRYTTTSKSHNGTILSIILIVLILCAGNLINFSCSAVTCHCRIGSRNVWVTEFDQISHRNLELSLCFVFGQNACNMLLLYLLLYFLFLLVVSL